MPTKNSKQTSSLSSSVKVDIAQARIYSNTGQWLPNKKYDPTSLVRETKMKNVWLANYSVLWRPEPELPEDQQYAVVSPAI